MCLNLFGYSATVT